MPHDDGRPRGNGAGPGGPAPDATHATEDGHASFVRDGAASLTDAHLDDLLAREQELRERFDRPGPIGHVVSDLNLMVALVRDYREQRYREVPWWALSAVVFCLLYVVSPVDALPDVIPVLGRLDDAAVLGACLMLVDQELQKYKRWRFEQLRHGDASAGTSDGATDGVTDVGRDGARDGARDGGRGD